VSNSLTARIAQKGDEVKHLNSGHQFKLSRVLKDLPDTHVLIYCEGCEWYLRWPKRESEKAESFRAQHIGSAHLQALFKGRYCIAEDMTDGGEAYLRSRLKAVR
jgi:hypothetical protein